MDHIVQSSTAFGLFATSVALVSAYRQQKLNKISKIAKKLSNEKIYDCIIIGAGASGLRAAHNLHHKYNVPLDNILVLEAQDYIGGRIRQGLDFIPGVKIELGAEILHGNNTLLTEFAKETGEPIEEIYCWAHGDGGPLQHPVNGGYGLYYFGKGNGGASGKREKGKLLRFDDKTDESFLKLNETLWALSEYYHEDAVSENLSLNEYLTLLNFNNDMKNMINAGFSNTLCTNSNDLSLKQSVRWTRLWNIESDEGEFKLKNSYSSLINYLKKDLNIIINKPVIKIESINDENHFNHVILTTNDNKQYYTKTTIISASPDVIKRNLIQFIPELPNNKKLAFQCTYMHTAMKVFIKFSKICWPKGLSGMIMTDPDFLFPEIWFRDVTDLIDSNNSNDGVCYATGFATSGYADKILTLSKEEVYNRFVEQLDIIFNELTPDHWINLPVLPLPKPSEVFLGGTMQVWSPTNHPYIGGGYCSPRAGYPVTSGAMIAEPVDGLLYFSGEATNVGAGATCHAALESGIRCADQIAAHLKLSKVGK